MRYTADLAGQKRHLLVGRTCQGASRALYCVQAAIQPLHTLINGPELALADALQLQELALVARQQEGLNSSSLPDKQTEGMMLNSTVISEVEADVTQLRLFSFFDASPNLDILLSAYFFLMSRFFRNPRSRLGSASFGIRREMRGQMKTTRRNQTHQRGKTSYLYL